MPAHCEARIPYDAGVAEGMAWRTDVTRRTKSEDVLRCSLLLGLLAGVLPDRLVLAGDGLCFIPNGRDLQRLGQAIVHVSGRTAERVGRLGRRRSVARTWNKIDPFPPCAPRFPPPRAVCFFLPVLRVVVLGAIPRTTCLGLVTRRQRRFHPIEVSNHPSCRCRLRFWRRISEWHCSLVLAQASPQPRAVLCGSGLQVLEMGNHGQRRCT